MTDQDIVSCYRHIERPTALACSECGRAICVECSTQAPVGQLCPECVRARGTQVLVRAGSGRAATGQPATVGIIAVVVAIQLMKFAQPDLWNSLAERLAMWNRGVAAGEWWRMATVVLFHGGIVHIGFNSFLLYQLGPRLEHQIGSIRLLVVFVVTAVGGSAFAFHLGGPDDFGIGMSGAVLGVVGVWMASGYRHRHTAQGRNILNSLMGLIVLNAVVPFLVPNVSWQAHLGGLATGFVLGQMWSWIGRRGSVAFALHVVSGLALALVAVLSTRL